MMKELIISNSVEGWVVRILIVAACAFIAMKIGEHVSAFFVAFTIGFHGILGYGLTGLLLGFALWSIFDQGAMKTVYWLPPLIVLAQWIVSYNAFGESGRSADFSPLEVLGYMLTSGFGFKRLVVLPVGAFAAIWLLEKYRSPAPKTETETTKSVP